MKYYTRKIVTPSTLNAGGHLFGGQALAWIDEEAAIFAACRMETTSLVTKLISEVNFMSPGQLGDVIEIGCELVSSGTTSCTIACELRNKTHQRPIVRVDRIVFVAVNQEGVPVPHALSAQRGKPVSGRVAG